MGASYTRGLTVLAICLSKWPIISVPCWIPWQVRAIFGHSALYSYDFSVWISAWSCLPQQLVLCSVDVAGPGEEAGEEWRDRWGKILEFGGMERIVNSTSLYTTCLFTVVHITIIQYNIDCKNCHWYDRILPYLLYVTWLQTNTSSHNW